MRTEDTAEDTHSRLMAFSKDIGKHPVTCRDTEGFIVNRLLGPYIGVSSHRVTYEPVIKCSHWKLGRISQRWVAESVLSIFVLPI